MKKMFVLLSLSCFIVVFSLTSSVGCSCCGKKTEGDNPHRVKLVLMVVVDQLRADAVSRLEHRFGEGGFRYLMQKGVWYKNARYRHCTTLTAVGHATIFTGAAPADHGIVGNYWLDRFTGKVISSVENKCPGQLTATTIGDELVLASGHRSRVFSVSIKDRGAILPGGYLGKAFWYDKTTGGFQTWPHYYKTPPAWLTAWNNEKRADRFRKMKWAPLNDLSTYIYGNDDDRDEEKTYNKPYKRGAAFPHSLEKFKDDEFYRQLPFTPFADELTFEFARHAATSEKLGRGEWPDMLTVSFSVTDYVGHAYGPCSLEYEDNILRLDITLRKLFRFIDETVGLDRTLIVLTGDHGVDLSPEYRQRLGMVAGRIDPAEMKRRVNEALRTKYRESLKKEKIADAEDVNFFLGFRNPSVYLDLGAVEKFKLDIGEVEQAAADALMEMEGIAFAVTRSRLLRGNVPDTRVLQTVMAVFHPKRSGSVLIVQEPFWFMYHVHDDDTAMHGAPYSYDNHVPVFFSGPGMRRREVYRLVRPRDIAASVALTLGIEAPSGSPGSPLLEVIDRY
jgi:predicted AlkP superfamily pyrophosphatase or phosphodiesterase